VQHGRLARIAVVAGCALLSQAAGAAGSAAVAAPAASRPAMERVASADGSVVLIRPRGWRERVVAAGPRLQVSVSSADGSSIVELEHIDNRSRRLDTRRWMGERLAELRSRHADLTVTRGSTCRDEPPSCAEVSIAYTRNGQAQRARLFLHADAQVATLRGYHAPAATLDVQRPLLLDILTNIRVRMPPPVAARLVRRQAPDNSLSLALPADWGFVAGNGAVLAAAPQGRAGFVFTVFQVMPQSFGVQPPPGVIVSGWRSPQDFVEPVFAQLGNRQIRVLSWQPDHTTAGGCPSQIGRQCEAADVLVSWLSPEGSACTGAFKLLNARPNLAGQWFSIVTGIWGPSADLARHLPMLGEIAASFGIRDAYARRYIEQGMARLREQERRTRQAVQELYGAIAQNQRDYEDRAARKDASEAKWDDYRRGNSYWISDLEGGKVYQADPWGIRDTRSGDRIDGPPYDYVHFEGRNPAHPSEQMREISSFEMQRLNR